MKYRKKPVVIEAWRNLIGSEIPDWLQGKGVGITGMNISIYTLEGIMTAHPGDYIIKGVKDEVYPCKPDIFEQTYEKVGGDGKE